MDWKAVAEWCQETMLELERSGNMDGLTNIVILYILAQWKIASDPHTRG